MVYTMKANPRKSFGQKLIDTFIPQKGDTSRQLTGKVIALLAAVLILLALVMCGLIIRKYAIKDALSEPAKDYPKTSSLESSGPTGSAASGEEDDFDKNVYVPETPVMNPELGVLEDFTNLFTTNKDVVGYLRIDGTGIDTAVVQGEDNSYYLERTIEKKYNAFGIPFLDFRARVEKDYQSDNLTIYGHAAKDGSLFGTVKDYADIEYYRQHPYLTFDTIYGKAQYKIVGAFMARVYTDAAKAPDPEEFNYHMFVDAEGNAAAFDAYMDEVYKRSYWRNPDVDVAFGDKLVTLSTCDSIIHPFGAATEYRQVLVARRIRQGEVIDVDVSKAVVNEDMIMPKAWQQKFGKENPYQ